MVFYEKLKIKREESPFSKEIIKLLNDNNDIIVNGLTKITLTIDVLKIEYSGDDTHTIENINWDLLDVKLPSIKLLKELFHTLIEQGHPSYYYIIKFQL